MSVGVSLRELPGISLEQLDERASLLRRMDTKYAIDERMLSELLSRLAHDHEVLEIDGRRMFRYESVYFDTPELRCFHDHVEDRMPRFKARTRLYRDTGHCVFEVKLKVGEGQTDKRQVNHGQGAADRIDGESERCLREALDEAGLKAPASGLHPSLRTEFTRFTLAPAGRAERTTCDRLITLERPGAGRARLHDGVVIVETKSEHADGPADRALEGLGVEPMALSKYRTGIALLVAEAKDPDSPRAAEGLFEVDRC